jgi:ABC-type uncharacterized transport system involved in gliding motility auxiliary subunit
MAQRSQGGRRRLWTLAAVALAVVLFFAVNVLAGVTLTTTRLDLTADGLFTVSDGTRRVLSGIDEPIRLRFYRSRRLDEFGPYFAGHAKRVEELLQHYARLSRGRIIVERFDPAPYSPEEDLAVADGIQALTVGEGGGLAYFGIAGTNSTDDRKALPYLAPERAAFLEYDLTRIVHDLAHPDKPVLAVIGDLPLFGDRLSGFRPWLIVDVLEQSFKVRSVTGTVDRFDDDVAIVVLAQPASVDERTLYAVDQFVMRGGRVLAFVDPLAEVLAQARPGLPSAASAAATVEPLLAAWGVAIAGDKVVGDRAAAVRVRARHDGRPVVTDYLAWLNLTSDHFAADDVVSGDLKVLMLKTAGAVRPRPDATTRIEPLVSSSIEAGLLDVEPLRMLPDPVALLRGFAPTGERYVLAARVTGPVRSAFPDGPPAAVTDAAVRTAHRTEAAAPFSLIVVGDADLLAEDTWMQTTTVLGQEVAVPTANNADLVLNALESLSGGGVLGGLRGRGVTDRRFQVLEEMSRRAEDQFRATEETLRGRIEETRRRIGDLQRQEQEGGVLLTQQQQSEIESFRNELIRLRQQLREVQFALRKDVESLENRAEIVNIWAVPVIVAVVALVLAALQRRRAARARAEAVRG